MKTIFITFIFTFFSLSIVYSQVGIGIQTPDATAMLDVTSLTKGFLLPRMTDAERDAILTPPEGLVIYNTTVKCLQWFNGSFWYDKCSGVLIPIQNPNLTVASPTYQGVSVINTTGIGYNGENVPAASTITVQLTNSSASPQTYGLVATDSGTGLQYIASGTIAGIATIPVVLQNNGTSIAWDKFGVLTMPLTGASNVINLLPRIDIKSIPASATAVADVTHGTQTWMDRNLGARRAATAANDVFSFGNHYQWGRPSDGHEITVLKGDDLYTNNVSRGFYNGTALNVLATSDIPGYPNFILTNSGTSDWRDDNNNNRWAIATQGPCPAGYHVPSQAEWITANTFGAWSNRTDAFNSTLKLPSSGRRNRSDNWLINQGSDGYYWSTTPVYSSASPIGWVSFQLVIDNVQANPALFRGRAHGISVRCIKN